MKYWCFSGHSNHLNYVVDYQLSIWTQENIQRNIWLPDVWPQWCRLVEALADEQKAIGNQRMTLDNCYDLLKSTTNENMICSQKCSGQSVNQVFEIDLFSFLYMTKTPSEMKVAQCYKLIKLFTLLTLLPQLTLLPPQCSGSNLLKINVKLRLMSQSVFIWWDDRFYERGKDLVLKKLLFFLEKKTFVWPFFCIKDSQWNILTEKLPKVAIFDKMTFEA